MAGAPEDQASGLPGRKAAIAAIALVALALAVAGLLEVGSPQPGPRTVTDVPRVFDAAPAPRATSHRGPGGSPRTRPVAARAPSIPVGWPYDGRLEGGVPLRPEGATFFTWDPIRRSFPNRLSRRYGTDRLVYGIERVLASYARANPGAARVGIGDLSRPGGGPFGSDLGGLGHRSHQNGLDVDIYYPRRDRAERPPSSPEQIDRRLAADLVDRFVRAGSQYVFVGPRTGLDRPGGIVQELKLHDDHLHVRIPPP